MVKREYDRMKHSGRKNRHDLSKDYTKGGKGWGDALTDYTQQFDEEWGEEYEEDTLIQYNDDYFKPEDLAKPVSVSEQLVARMLADDGPFKKDDCVALFEYTVEEGAFNFHFKNTEGEDFWMLAKGEGSEYMWYDPETQKQTDAPKLRIIPIRRPKLRSKGQKQSPKPAARPQQQQQRPLRRADPAQANDSSSWSVEDVRNFVMSQGAIFEQAALAFERCLVDGEVLREVTFKDLEQTIGGGLSTRKLWVEIKKLRN